MKFFILETDQTYKNYPQVKSWYEKIDYKYLTREHAYKLEERQLFFIEEKETTVFTSVISMPLPLVTETVKKVFDMYEHDIVYRQVILLDQKYERSEVYYLPILEEIDCMAEGSEWNKDKSHLKKLVIDYSKTNGKTAFRLAGVNKYYMIVRIDLAESILKRNVTGIGLKEVEVLNGF